MTQGKVNIKLSVEDAAQLTDIISICVSYRVASGYNDDDSVIQAAKRLKDKIIDCVDRKTTNI